MKLIILDIEDKHIVDSGLPNEMLLKVPQLDFDIIADYFDDKKHFELLKETVKRVLFWQNAVRRGF